MRWPSPRRAWAAVVVLSLCYVLSFADRLIISIMVEPIKHDFGLSDSAMGLLMGSSFGFTYAIFGVVFGRIADRGHRLRLISVGVILWSLGTLLSAFAHEFWQLLTLRTGVGIGEAALTPATLSLISDLFRSEKRTLPMSVFLASGLVGATGAYMLGGVAVTVASGLSGGSVAAFASMAPWRIVLVMLALPGFILAPILLVTIREPVRTGVLRQEPFAPREIVAHLARHRRGYGGLLIGLGLLQVLAYGMAVWYPTLLIRGHGMRAADAGLAYGLVGMAWSVSGTLAIPAVTHQLRRTLGSNAISRVGASAIGVAAPLLIGAFLVPGAGFSLALIGPAIFLLIGVGTRAPIALQVLPPNQMRAQVTALYFLGANILGLGVAPLLVAALASAYSGISAIGAALATLVAVIAPVSLFLLQRSQGYLPSWVPDEA